jgi:hypothetical protein
MPICSSIFSSLTDNHVVTVDGDRAVFIAQNGIDLLRVLAGDAAQRIAVIAADAVGDIAPSLRMRITSPRESCR